MNLRINKFTAYFESENFFPLFAVRMVSASMYDWRYRNKIYLPSVQTEESSAILLIILATGQSDDYSNSGCMLIPKVTEHLFLLIHLLVIPIFLYTSWEFIAISWSMAFRSSLSSTLFQHFLINVFSFLCWVMYYIFLGHYKYDHTILWLILQKFQSSIMFNIYFSALRSR